MRRPREPCHCLIMKIICLFGEIISEVRWCGWMVRHNTATMLIQIILCSSWTRGTLDGMPTKGKKTTTFHQYRALHKYGACVFFQPDSSSPAKWVVNQTLNRILCEKLESNQFVFFPPLFLLCLEFSRIACSEWNGNHHGAGGWCQWQRAGVHVCNFPHQHPGGRADRHWRTAGQQLGRWRGPERCHQVQGRVVMRWCNTTNT